MSVVLLLPACTVSLATEEDDGVVAWSGFVFSSPAVSEETYFGTGTVDFAADGAEPVAGEQPYVEDYPGYWAVELPASVPVVVNLDAEAAWPTVWQGVTPGTDGRWLSGALFAADVAYMTELFAALPFPMGTTPSDLDESGLVHVWGSPADTGWDCADVRVAEATPTCFAIADDGSVTRVSSGEFDWFLAVDVAPGTIVVASGLGAEAAYAAAAGSVVMAHYFYGGAS